MSAGIELQVSKLPEMDRLSLDLYDPDTAELLLGQGSRLDRETIDGFASSGYTVVFASNNPDDVENLRRRCTFDTVALLTIEPDTSMASDLYDENGTFLVAKGTKLSATILSSLARRKVKNVLVRKEYKQEHLERLQKLRACLAALSSAVAFEEVRREEFSADETINDPSQLKPRAIQKIAMQMEASGQMTVKVDPKKSLGKSVKFVDPFKARDEKVKVHFTDVYSNLLRQTEDLFAKLKSNEPVESRMILEMCDQLVAALVTDRQLLLCSMFTPHESKDYLAKHCLNCSIIAINIATAHGYSPKMVVEVGYGALLMDVGMLDVPDTIRFKQARLTLIEINEIKRHTIFGMDRLQYIRHLPKTTPLVAYQSHERLDGTGYPHGKRTHAIHDYSKICQVADVYNAMISERPYKTTPTLPYKAMEELLQMVSKNKMDRRFVRSLLVAISLFPVASWVKLTTGEVARVLHPNEKDFTRPYIVILFNQEGEPVNPQRINLAEDGSRKVASAVKMNSEPVMAGF